jgi:hypothetical protein
MDGDQVAPCARRDLSLAQLATTSNLAHGVLQQVHYTAASLLTRVGGGTVQCIGLDSSCARCRPGARAPPACER